MKYNNYFMLEFPSFNYFAILVGVIFNILLGFFWYDPNTPPGKVWLKEIGYTSEEMKPNPKLFGMNFGFGILTIFGLALFIAWSGADTFLEGMIVGFELLLVFVIATSFNTVSFEKRNGVVWGVYVLYQFLTFVLVGGLLAVWN